jgi:putative Ca2+/H+ antiporter (TMEM165/GDT1 family)
MLTWPGGGLSLARRKGLKRVDPWVALICFPVIFLGELPDKTMFASLLLATRGRPLNVWLGAAGAFAVHVVLATTVAAAALTLLSRQAVDAAVAGLFLFSAIYGWMEARRGDKESAVRGPSRRGALVTAFLVIFLAEWGDLTQILTANLAIRYHSPLSVAVGSLLALGSVAAIAVTGGQTLLRFTSAATIRRVTAVVLVGLAVYTAWAAVH